MSNNREPSGPIPRTLAGWPEGMVYVPRPVIDMRALVAAEDRTRAAEFVKQHRGRGKRIDEDR